MVLKWIKGRQINPDKLAGEWSFLIVPTGSQRHASVDKTKDTARQIIKV